MRIKRLGRVDCGDPESSFDTNAPGMTIWRSLPMVWRTTSVRSIADQPSYRTGFGVSSKSTAQIPRVRDQIVSTFLPPAIARTIRVLLLFLRIMARRYQCEMPCLFAL